MRYNNVQEGIFIERPNRFIAYVNLNGETVKCHVKNTGRCRELLIPGKTKVYLEDHGVETNRKTRYSLITVEKGSRIINMDSQAPNQIAAEWIKNSGFKENIIYVKREQTYKNSRFDIYYECADGTKGFVEVKGVTLEENGIVKFPDAPTKRGEKHVHELIHAKEEGYEANILFVIQMDDVKYLEPNYATHKEFGDALVLAQKSGVNIMAIDCTVTKNEVKAGKFVAVKL